MYIYIYINININKKSACNHNLINCRTGFSRQIFIENIGFGIEGNLHLMNSFRNNRSKKKQMLKIDSAASRGAPRDHVLPLVSAWGRTIDFNADLYTGARKCFSYLHVAQWSPKS